MRLYTCCFLGLWLAFSCSSPTNESDTLKTEVLVVGGGASGVAAALQAARSGAQVTLVEETPWLGGMLTAAGVSAIDGNHRLPSGIWGEFRSHLYEHYGGPDSVETGWVSNTLYEPSVGNDIWNRLVGAEKNLQRYHGYRPIKVIDGESQVEGVWFVGQPEQDTLKILAEVTIEATELGDVLKLAKVPHYTGQDPQSLTGEAQAPASRTDAIQDLTYALIVEDFGPEADMTLPLPDGYDPEEFNCACKELCDDPEFEVVGCEQMLTYGKLPNGKYMLNWPINGNDYYFNSLDQSHQQRQTGYQAAKMQSLRFLYHIQTQAGFKHLGIAKDEFPTEDGFPLIPYHRESRRVKGSAFLTVNHLQDPYSDSLYQFAVAVGDYPLDHHHDKNPDTAEETFPSIPSFSIPYGCLIPEKMDGLIVAEKSISVSHLANGSTRLQPCVILIGQAAGAAAALSVRDDLLPRQLNIRTLQQHLLEAGCWLMPFIDTQPNDSLYFQAVQRVGVAGLMKGTGVPYQWANQTWFYSDSLVRAEDIIQALKMVKEENNSIILSGNPVSRGSLVSALWQWLGSPEASQQASFVDIKDNAAASAIDYFSQQQWLEIWAANQEFQAEKPVTRKEAAYLLDKALGPFAF